MVTVVGTVGELRLYPIKSWKGCVRQQLRVGWPGVIGDRRLVTVDDQTGKVITAKLTAGQTLLDCSVSAHEGGVEVILLPSYGSEPLEIRDPIAAYELGELLGRKVRFVAVGDKPRAMPTNQGFSLRPGVGYDSSPFHILADASQRAGAGLYSADGAFHLARPRPNILILTDSELVEFREDTWVGRHLRFGNNGPVLGVRKLTPRCAELTRPQPQFGLSQDGGPLTALKRHHDGNLGVYAFLADPGSEVIGVGDEVFLL